MQVALVTTSFKLKFGRIIINSILDVFEKATSVADCGSIRRCDIIVSNSSEDKGMILDLTI